MQQSKIYHGGAMGGVGGFRGFGGGSFIQGVQVLPWAATLDIDLDHYNVFFTSAEFAIAPVANLNAPVGGYPGQTFYVILEQPADLCSLTYDYPGYRFNSNDWGEELYPFLGHIYNQVILTFLRNQYGNAWFVGSEILTTTELRDEDNLRLIQGHNGQVLVTAPKGVNVDASDATDGNVLIDAKGTTGVELKAQTLLSMHSVGNSVKISADHVSAGYLELMSQGTGLALYLRSVRGQIKLQAYTRALIDTSNGDIQLVAHGPGGVLISSSADSININATGVTHNVNLSSADGDISLSADDSISLHASEYSASAIELIAYNGSIKMVSGVDIILDPSGELKISGLPVYADNAAAIAGGLVATDVYRTATGQLMIVY